jgi:phytoene synthase
MNSQAAERSAFAARAETELFASYAAAERLARRVGSSFYLTFSVLPSDLRRDMCVLYAFMRAADDIADGPESTREKHAKLTAFRDALHQSLAGGVPNDEPWRSAFADVIDRRRLPGRYFHAVLDGVETDLQPCEFATFADLYGYCYRVASAVGLLCIRLWGADDPRADLPAERLGVAFQLTNVLRDAAEDAARGRVYLPTDTLRRFGLSPAEFQRADSAARTQAIAWEAERAATYFRLGRETADYLPPSGRAVLAAMIGVYEAILIEIRRRPARVFRERVSAPWWKKARALATAWPLRFLPDRRSTKAGADH